MPTKRQTSATQGRVTYPFAAVVGNRGAKRALTLLAIEPELRGVLIGSESGSSESTLARGFGSLMADYDESRVDSVPAVAAGSTCAELNTGLVELPLTISEDRLLGGLDLEGTLASGARKISIGLLAQADKRVIYADNANLLSEDTVAHIAQAIDSRQVRVEREGVSAIHAADFTLVATFNPAEGDVSPSLRDRVALIVHSPADLEVGEKAEVIDRTFRFDEEPRSFVDEFAFETARIRNEIAQARALHPRVLISRDQVRQLALIALSLAVEGNRADVLAAKAARANAALAGRDHVDDEDMLVASQLVLVPRAKTNPAEQGLKSQNEDSSQEPLEEDHQIAGDAAKPETTASALEDLIITAIDQRVPTDLLTGLPHTGPSFRQGTRVAASRSTRGRHVGSVTHRPRDARVAIEATLRAAAQYQPARQLKTGGRTKVKIESGDLRFKRFKQRSGLLFIFAVDASGSMALNRMAQAKGVVTRLLKQAYLHRDKVALVSFRGKDSQVLLTPTRSVELARRLVDTLPAGGGTPISAGILKSLELARLARIQKMPQAMLVLFTDGRANVGVSEGRFAIRDELNHLGRLLRSEGITSVVVDTRSRFVSCGEARELASALGSRYFYLPRADAATLSKAISSVAENERRKFSLQ
ncbi:MAG: magnesium chelatase ATPase subunit D [Blastocatellia bacterium]